MGGEAPLTVISVGKIAISTVSNLDIKGVNGIDGLEWGQEIRDLKLVSCSSLPWSGGLEDDSDAEAINGSRVNGYRSVLPLNNCDLGDCELG